MNTQVAVISVREKLEQALEGLICFAATAIVVGGTAAICFPSIG